MTAVHDLDPWRRKREHREDIERYAGMAYRFAGLNPDHPAGTADVLAALFQSQGIRDGMRLVNLGIEAGRASMEFSQGPRRPMCALILRRQTQSEAMLACAHGCAQFVVWTLGEIWDEAAVLELAMAVVLPAAPLSEWAGHDAEAIADRFGTDIALVLQRQAEARATI